MNGQPQEKKKKNERSNQERKKKKKKKQPTPNPGKEKKRKEKKKKKKKNSQRPTNKKKKKKSKVGQKLRLWVPYACLITILPLSYELWKLKTAKSCFQFEKCYAYNNFTTLLTCHCQLSLNNLTRKT